MADDQHNSTHYKLVTYESAQGPRAGAVLNDAVFDLAELTGKSSYATMVGVLEDWAKAEPLIEAALAKKVEKGSGATAGSPLAKVRLLGAGSLPSGYLLRGRQLFRSHG